MEGRKMADHAFKVIGKDIKERRIKPVVLLYGQEQYLVDWAAGLLCDSFVNPVTRQMDLSVFDASVNTADEVIAACETIAMLSERRTVILKVGNDKLKLDEDELIEYLGSVPESSLLILDYLNEEKAKKLFKAAQKVATVYEFGPLDEKALTAFIGKRLRAEGKNMDRQALREFIGNSGYFEKESDYRIYNLVNDIQKIAAYSLDEIISKDDVDAVMGHSLEKNVFAMIEAVSRGKKDDAFRIMNDLLTSGSGVFSLLALLISQFELLLSMKQLKAEGYNAEQIAKTIKVHEYRVKKAMSLVDRYQEKNIKDILIRAYEVENQIKSGDLPETLALEMFVASI